MTTIYDNCNKIRSFGKNLNILNRYASKCGGVEAIEISIFNPQNGDSDAEVTVIYTNGLFGVTHFKDPTVACNWANRKVIHKNSWWTGASVIVNHSNVS
jgi:hypothetical protein